MGFQVYNSQGQELQNLTGSAGGDLTGTYPNPTIATGAVTSAKIADGTIATADIGASQVTFAKLGWPVKVSLASTPAEFNTSSGSATDVTGASISVSETAGGFTIVQHSCQLKSTGGSGEAYSWIHSDSSVGSIGSNAIGMSLGAPAANTSATPRTKVASGTYTWVGSSAVAPCPTTRTTTYKIQIAAGVNPSAYINNVTLTAWTFAPS